MALAAYAALYRNPLAYLARAARKYGDIVHLQIEKRHDFLLNHPDYLRTILLDHEGIRRSVHRPLQRTLGQGLLTSCGKVHRKQRTLLRDVRELVRRTVDSYGALDFAHNNGGIEGTRARVAALEETDWDRTIATNLKGVWLCMKFEIRQMARQGRGAIVNTASVAGHVGLSRFGAYAASKHGVVGLTKTAALEYMKLGIRINAISPGFIDTAMVDRALSGTGKPSDTMLQRLRSQVARGALTLTQPARRMGSATEVAQAVMWLCSDSASFVNGHTLVIDGGFLAK